MSRWDRDAEGGAGNGSGKLRLRVVTIPRDEPPIRIVHAWWEDLHGQRRESAAGSCASFTSERPPVAAIGEAIERRAWLNTHEAGRPTMLDEAWKRGTSAVGRATSPGPIEAHSTNGWACGTDERDAAGRAIAELIERHLYSLHYLGQIQAHVDRSDRCLDRRAWLSRYRLELHVHCLEPIEGFPLSVRLAYLFDETLGGPGATIGLGCSIDEDAAIDKAVLEALKVRMWAHTIKDRLRASANRGPVEPVEARLLRLGSPSGVEALRRFMTNRVSTSDAAAASGRRAGAAGLDMCDRAERAADQLGIECFVVDRGPLRLLDLRPVVWVVGRGARFVNDEPVDPAWEMEVPLA